MSEINSAQQNSVRIREILSRTTDILTLPMVVQEILEITSSANSSAADLTDIIESDPALTTKILTVANSAYYGFVKKVSTISHAVVVLGFQEIQNIALSTSVVQLFDRRGSEFSSNLWRHSFAVGVASRMIASYLNLKMDGKYFVGGLLHDVGKIFLSQYLPGPFSQLLSVLDAPENTATYHALEQEIFGISHAEIGGALLANWMFPTDICAAVTHHHDPGAAGHDPAFVVCVHVADLLCSVRGLTPLNDNYFLSLDPHALEVLTSFKEDFGGGDLVTLLKQLDLEIERQNSFVSAFK